MPDYNNAKIYKIECSITGEIYIGSTCEPTLARRLAKHVSCYKSWKRGKGNNVTSFDIIDRGEYKIMLIENFICNSKDELAAREGHYIKEYRLVDKVVNRKIEGRTKKEYNQDNKEKQGIQYKLYYINHKEEINLYKAKYRTDNAETIKEKKSTPFLCECGAKFRHDGKAEHLRSQKHLKFVDNPGAIKVQRSTPFKCECGGRYTHQHRTEHLRSKQHLKFVDDKSLD
jgi:hypothetical protein